MASFFQSGKKRGKNHRKKPAIRNRLLSSGRKGRSCFSLGIYYISCNFLRYDKNKCIFFIDNLKKKKFRKRKIALLILQKLTLKKKVDYTGIQWNGRVTRNGEI